jgi:hypothetical protein
MEFRMQSSDGGSGLPLSPEVSIYDLFAELKKQQDKANKIHGPESNDTASDELIFDDDVEIASAEESFFGDDELDDDFKEL